MIHLENGTYGTLIELAPELGLAPGTLKVAAHRHKDAFPAPVGWIAGKRVYRLTDIADWWSQHNHAARRKTSPDE